MSEHLIKVVEPKAEENLIVKVKEVISRIGSIHRYPVSNSSPLFGVGIEVRNRLFAEFQ